MNNSFLVRGHPSTHTNRRHTLEDRTEHTDISMCLRELRSEGHETGCVLSDRGITGQRARHIMRKHAVRSMEELK